MTKVSRIWSMSAPIRMTAIWAGKLAPWIGALLAATIAWAGPAVAAISVQSWGGDINLYTLTNENGMEVRITNYGGRITSVEVPDRKGNVVNVVEGFDSADDYKHYNNRHGAIVGRFANRIKDNTYQLGGVTYHVTHDGQPYDDRIWDASVSDLPEPKLILTLVDPDGTMGFPGTAKIVATYTLTNENILRLDFQATTDRDTVMSLTNHSYFNMAGAGKDRTILGQLLTLNADNFTVSDEMNVPTGEVRSVAGTPFDFRKPTPIGLHINDPRPMLIRARGYDANFVINGTPGTMRLVARLEDTNSGRVLEEWSTQAGVQVYTANRVSEAIPPSIGYVQHGALALEAQAFPNSPNIASFPSANVTPKHPLHEVIEFRFTTDGARSPRGAH